MDTVIISKSLTSPSANCVCKSQSMAGAGNLILNGGSVAAGVATLDTQRRLSVVSAGDDSAVTFTFTGGNQAGNPIKQALLGTNKGTLETTLDFLTVTQIATDGATGGAVTVGTDTTGSTPWKNPNIHLTPFNLAIENAVTGTVTYNIEFTMDDYFTPAPTTAVPRVRSTVVNGATADTSFDFSSAIRGWRTTITAGTGTVTAEAIQAGITNS